MREKVTYYNINGEVDHVTTWINNNEWSVVLVVILSILIVGFIEAL